MTEITDAKLVYEEFKFFKNIFVSINKCDKFLLAGNSETEATLSGVLDTNFFKFSGTITGNTNFLKWLNGKTVSVKLEDIKPIKSCLKKNALKVSYTDTTFSFIFLTDLEDKSTEEKEIQIVASNIKIDKTSNIENATEKEITLDSELLIVNDGTEKILEVPTARLLVLQSDKEAKYFIKYSNIENNVRRVQVKSISLKYGLTLEQEFYTI